MSRSIVTAAVLGLLAVGACKKKESDPAPKVQATEPEAPKPEPAKEPAADSTAAIGVEAGGIQRDEQEGPAGILANVNGTVEVKRVGETQWTAAAKDAKLYPGDTVRTGESSSATVAFADESTAEVAEVSTLAVASRDGTADPGSSAAVLGGLTRFTVTPRAPGEGAFRVYTSSGVVITKGTTYGVGVAASGEARIGVESGAVDVIGIAALDAQPVVVEKSSQVVIAADGKVGSAAAWTTDDWGTWRDDTDAKVQVVASVDAHGQALADLNQALIDGYAALSAVDCSSA